MRAQRLFQRCGQLFQLMHGEVRGADRFDHPIADQVFQCPGGFLNLHQIVGSVQQVEIDVFAAEACARGFGLLADECRIRAIMGDADAGLSGALKADPAFRDHAEGLALRRAEMGQGLAVQGLDRTIIIDVSVIDPGKTEIKAGRKPRRKPLRRAAFIIVPGAPGAPDGIGVV